MPYLVSSCTSFQKCHQHLLEVSLFLWAFFFFLKFSPGRRHFCAKFLVWSKAVCSQAPWKWEERVAVRMERLAWIQQRHTAAQKMVWLWVESLLANLHAVQIKWSHAKPFDWGLFRCWLFFFNMLKPTHAHLFRLRHINTSQTKKTCKAVWNIVSFVFCFCSVEREVGRHSWMWHLKSFFLILRLYLSRREEVLYGLLPEDSE